MNMKNVLQSPYFIPVVACLFLWPVFNAAEALVGGILIALLVGNPYPERTKKWTQKMLSLSVVGLGAGMNLIVVGQVGVKGIGYTVISIFGSLLLGLALGRLFKTEKDTSMLVSVGTAICGGSAIAAMAPVLKAKSHEVSVSLGIVFLLNAAALFIFPWVGHHMELTEAQFGLWSALAIHDTSSVVGATMQYGPHALEVGTTVKLARALWIVPVTLLIGYLRSRSAVAGEVAGKAKKPYFILGFLIVAALVTWIPELRPAGHVVEFIAKRVLVVTLFLIGTGMTRETLKNVGFRPFAQGFILWVIVASTTLLAIRLEWMG